MRIQLASDLHLESRTKQTFRELLEPRVAPILALLGDVAPLSHPNLRPFLEWCSENWDTVLWIPGCVELLGPGSGNEGVRPNDTAFVPNLVRPVEAMRRMAEPFWNITVLDHDGMVSEDGVYIFGLPFWKFPRDENAPLWHPGLYKWVEAEPSPIHPDLMRALYKQDLAWIRARLKAQHEPVVILSHFGPTVWIQEEAFVGDPDHTITFPDVEEMMKAPLVAWLCGHCHQSVQFVKEWADATGAKGTVLIATNPRGFPFENLEYNREAVVRIDPRLYGR